MSDIIAMIASMLASFLAIMIFAIFGRMLKAGPGRATQLRRKNYGVEAWARGSLSKIDVGSTIHELEGLSAKCVQGRLVEVHQTRAPTCEIA